MMPALVLNANADAMHVALQHPCRIRHRVSRCPHLAAGGLAPLAGTVCEGTIKVTNAGFSLRFFREGS